MRMTLLDLTQEILSSMDSDEVNSISDTVESMQVARLLRRVYYDIAVDLGLPEEEGLFEVAQLDGVADITKPVIMEIPSNVSKISWIKYNNKTDSDTNADYKDVQFMPFEQFLEMQSTWANSDASNVGQMSFTSNGETFEIMYLNDRFPKWFTTIGNDIVVFDAFDSDTEDTLTKARTMAYGIVYPVFTLADAFEPVMDPDEFSYYYNRAKVRAFNELKQQVNQEATAESRRQKVILQKRKRKIPDVPELERVARYGRK